MSLPEFDPNGAARGPRRRMLAALGWAVAGAVCVGGVWALGLVASLSLLHTTFSAESGPEIVGESLVMAAGGAVAGLVVGTVIGAMSRRRRDRSELVLGLTGAVCGSVGGGLTVPAIFLCDRWLHPLASSALVWTLIGFGAGLIGYGRSQRAHAHAEPEGWAAAPHVSPRRGILAAAGWVLTSGVCAGGVWAAALGLARLLFGASFLSEPLAKSAPALSVEFVALGAAYGVLVGGSVGFLRRAERPTSPLELGTGGGLFGALVGAVSVLTATTIGPAAHPLLSSSLAVSAVGSLAGFVGYAWSRETAKRAERADEDEDGTEIPPVKIEWLLHRPERKPFDRALVRVLPVLVTSVGALVAAVCVAPSDLAFALLAVGALGSSVGVVLYRQEDRLAALERRFRGQRE